jgi:hypothetical protein
MQRVRGLHTGDLEHDLAQMPFVADAREPATDPVGELLAKFARPLPHRFVANKLTVPVRLI